MARRRKGDKIDGWLVIDKPCGLTSTAVVNRVRRQTSAAKVGHAGTLDPIGTGVLPLAFGEATKTLPYVVDAAKTYRFTVRWGEARTTDDREGEVTATSPERPTAAEIVAALPQFTGLIEQVPPAYSAIKVDGERAYDLARADLVPDLASRPVMIDSIELAETSDADHAIFLVTCGKGAYMRGLARDLAVAVGTVGHVTALRRLSVGPFDESLAIPLECEGEVGHSARLLEHLLAVETALDDIPALAVTESEVARIRRGQAVPVVRTADRDLIGNLDDGATICALRDGKLVALTRLDGRQIRPVRVLNP
ncbi:MAG: tRNA pseudouridine(55) synthase TruB [Alphaproteobacteria bacterium]|nr:tRNA pseudouridine(55) synthase TruB [Alphaproteobacteria bacterium]